MFPKKKSLVGSTPGFEIYGSNIGFYNGYFWQSRSVFCRKLTNFNVKTIYPNDIDRELPDLHHGQLGTLVIFILGYIRIA